ncbi:transcriptional regulator, RpiR family [Pilibacter termitis]|uniref:Transcriptional regulator, RpiR family n=1 Tax=Pilibacter termitis TaxID=263852 RepID=A0A1T4P6Z2_9ENTE|nr:MurR/RpiR family transcriptional regulator [Pilibacter termitis]SJZ87303.1 transcriptional regulator, RpiR family [Pilibacter termitis]
MLIKEKMQTEKFSTSEQAIIAFLLENPETLDNLTVQQIATKTYTHPSALIRLAKKLGFSGYSELRNAYLEEWKYLNSHFPSIDANLPFTNQDGLITIAQKMARLTQNTVEDTLSLLHHDELKRAKEILLKADNIRIFGTNANTLISQDFALKMNRIRKNVATSTNLAESLYEAYNCPSTSCGILLSYTGENLSILRIAQALKERGLPVIAITSIGENSLSKLADCVLSITTRERLYSKIGNFTINTSICYLLDVLYSVVFAENYQKNLDHLIEIGQVIDQRTSSLSVIQEK